MQELAIWTLSIIAAIIVGVISGLIIAHVMIAVDNALAQRRSESDQ